MKRVVRIPKRISVFTASGIGVRRAEAVTAFGGSMIPEDMLRYDQAFVNPERFPKIVVFVTYSVTGRGLSKGTPTTARWASFIIKLTASPDLEGQITNDLLEHPQEWVTYRTKAVSHELEPITYLQFITEEIR